MSYNIGKLFPVGTRVMAKAPEDDNEDIVGKTGTVIDVYASYATIQFDNEIRSGHRGVMKKGKPGHCWDVSLNLLKIIPSDRDTLIQLLVNKHIDEQQYDELIKG